MSGKLLEAARRDIAKITQSGGFEEDILISNPSNGFIIPIKGLHSKHWIGFDENGNQINSKNAHVSFMELSLTLNGVQTRNTKTGNVDLEGFRVSVKDSSGVLKNYIVIQSFPSETTGLIVCILGDYKV